MNLKYGDYIFRETTAPGGYKKVEDIPFKVNQYGEIIIDEEIFDGIADVVYSGFI